MMEKKEESHLKSSSSGIKYEEVEVIDREALFNLSEIPENAKDFPTKTLKLFHSDSSARLIDEGETYEEYKQRRRLQIKIRKLKSKGQYVIMSTNEPFKGSIKDLIKKQ